MGRTWLSTSSEVDVGQIFRVLKGDEGYHPVVGTDKLASKGVHASVARDEAGFCALNTHLHAGAICCPHTDRPGPTTTVDLE